MSTLSPSLSKTDFSLQSRLKAHSVYQMLQTK